MNQVLFYSINPEHLVNILNGHKTIEVRKRDLPKWAKDKLARGEKVVGYGYCTKAEPYLNKDMGNWFLVRGIDYIGYPVLNGLIVVKFQVSKVTRHNPTHFKPPKSRFSFFSGYAISDKEMKDMCLDKYDLDSYGNGHVLYAHHFKNITPIEPMELGEFYSRVITGQNRDGVWWHIGEDDKRLTKAPQSFQSAWVKGE